MFRPIITAVHIHKSELQDTYGQQNMSIIVRSRARTLTFRFIRSIAGFTFVLSFTHEPG
jgi:hypothetical protein